MEIWKTVTEQKCQWMIIGDLFAIVFACVISNIFVVICLAHPISAAYTVTEELMKFRHSFYRKLPGVYRFKVQQTDKWKTLIAHLDN